MPPSPTWVWGCQANDIIAADHRRKSCRCFVHTSDWLGAVRHVIIRLKLPDDAAPGSTETAPLRQQKRLIWASARNILGAILGAGINTN